MATYTTPLRTIIEQPTQYRNDLTLDQRIEVGRKYLFDFDYPMFDERYKRVFETNFINNFYDREIGFETEHLFKRRLQHWLNVNMPYWSNMMESEQIKFDPLLNSEMNVKHTKKNDEKSETDRGFAQTDSRDTTDMTVTDEDTQKTTDKDVSGTHENKIESDTESNTTGTSTGSSDTDSSSKSDTDTNSNSETDQFNRKIGSDTPDTRLAITAKDGVGLIQYATNIEENKGNENSSSDGSENNVSSENSETNTTDETETDTTQSQTTNENGSSTEDTNISEFGERDETVDRTIGEKGKRDFDENIDGKKNSLEDFVQHRVGKIGVQTYSKMLMEYRQTFLRIEKDIFTEMNQLFMLVY